jgi:hypothetical protein
MILPDENTDLNNQEDFSDTDNDRPQDANADAAQANTDEFERSITDRQGAESDGITANTDEVRFNPQEQEEAVGQKQSDESLNQAPLTTQGSDAEIEENMGGTTNLTLDQLKKERDPEGTPGT